MKLYVYDHCPFCTKSRMIFGLKGLPLELSFLLEDDVVTPTQWVGKKTTPILQKDDGSHMAESMDIVHYVDQIDGQSVVAVAPDNSAIQQWQTAAWRPILDLAIPRLAQADLPEFATPEARQAFQVRQTKNFGEFDVLLSRTPELLQTVETQLQALAPLVVERTAIDTDDFTLYPSLRMLSIVKGISYPAPVTQYLERMQQATGVRLHADKAI